MDNVAFLLKAFFIHVGFLQPLQPVKMDVFGLNNRLSFIVFRVISKFEKEKGNSKYILSNSTT